MEHSLGIHEMIIGGLNSPICTVQQRVVLEDGMDTLLTSIVKWTNKEEQYTLKTLVIDPKNIDIIERVLFPEFISAIRGKKLSPLSKEEVFYASLFFPFESKEKSLMIFTEDFSFGEGLSIPGLSLVKEDTATKKRYLEEFKIEHSKHVLSDSLWLVKVGNDFFQK